MKICLRIDDIGLKPRGGYDEGLAIAKLLHDSLEGRPYLAGVIPGILDPAGAEWIRSKPEGMTIALHGWRHDIGMLGGNCEFEEMSELLCMQRIEQGLKNVALDHELIDFIPPRNAVSDGMLAACKRAGLARVWGQSYASDYPFAPEFKEYGLFIPLWTPLCGATLWRMSDTCRPVIDLLKKNAARPEAAIVCLHITWEANFSPAFRGIKELLRSFGDCIISPDEYITARQPEIK